jgi:hypothetical protein
MEDGQVTELVGRVEAALAAVEALPDDARECALDALAELLALYGEGWRRALAVIAARSGPNTVDRLVADELVGHLLMVHGLHPEQAALARSPAQPGPQLVQLEDRRASAAQ